VTTAGVDPRTIFPGDPRLTFPLREVARLIAGVSARSLADDCRAGWVLHVNRRGARSMTREQIAAAIDSYSSSSDAARGQDVVDLDAARAYNARRTSRRRSA
jgi:hypothetical protein